MRNIALASVVLLSSVSFNAVAVDIESALVGICDYLKQDDKNRFRKKLKDTNIKLRNVYDGISCGGEPLVRYAMRNGAEKTGSFIVGRLPQSHFETSGDLEWAKSNGFGGSAIATAIETR
jgi:hypothetical protein